MVRKLINHSTNNLYIVTLKDMVVVEEEDMEIAAAEEEEDMMIVAATAEAEGKFIIYINSSSETNSLKLDTEIAAEEAATTIAVQEEGK